MATPDEAREVGGIALADAEARLLERGADVRACGRLLAALRRGTEQVIAAREHGRDVRPYRDHLDELYRRLDANPLVDELPEPPRRRLRMSW